MDRPGFTANPMDTGATIRRRASQRKILTLVWACISFLCLVLVEIAIALALENRDLWTMPDTIQVSAGFVTGTFLLSLFMATRIVKWSRHRIREQLLSLWLLTGFCSIALMLFFRLPYSITYLGLASSGATVILFLFALNLAKRNRRRIGVPATLLDEESDLKSKDLFVVMPIAALPEEVVDMVAISDRQLGDAEWTPFLSWCALNAVPVIMLRDYVESVTGRVDLGAFKFNDLFRVHTSETYLLIKRLYDVIFSVIALAILLVPMLSVAVVIMIESPGPAIFRQKRIGLGGRVFTIYKFRSMVATADDHGAQFAQKGDARITRFGAFIRKYRIDEWPQLYNVLLGTMSIIGPRPEQVTLVDTLTREIPLFPFRHSVRPGITGWAQVCQGYAFDVASSSEKITYDLFYIKHLSLMLDVMIVIRTVKIVLSGFGSR
jgi:lipopolysaccharide/colanic/teichoic acid biosynthesis glycosyltransferase